MPFLSPNSTDVVLFSVGLLLVWRYLAGKRSCISKPPGPPGYPLIGNLFDMPTKEQHKGFAELASKYGPLTYLNVLGQPIILLSDVKIAIDLLEKRSALYSDRPTLRMAGELAGWENTLVLQKYGPHMRAYRKHFFRIFGSRTQVDEFNPIFEHAGHKMLKELLIEPDKFASALRRAAGAIILKIAYGYKVCDEDDSFVSIVEEAMVQFSELFETTYLVDFIPLLKHVPAWLPGAKFQRTAKKYRATLASVADLPMDFVKKRIAEETAEPSLVSDAINDGLVTNDQEEFELKWAAASAYLGGADTTVSAMHTFILAMVLFPEAQKKAQAEIDAVIGQDRLPTMADRPHLPFVTALHSEVLRWQPVAPMGLPHRLAEDDIYEGFVLPKGSIILSNAWLMLHDPAVYKDPLHFNPDRFVDSPGHSAEQDPRVIAFGFGRRICPGLNLADASTWLELALILSTLSISKAVDENGNGLIPSGKFLDGTVAFPEPFKCTIKPRSAHAEALIRAAE
ncbi:cytochrome P450 [Vararia minispora EC-137]|uniref:Cytochrome P450 n=1 Tax=Vararia minispora EC-137 TaxID=1314806 RepID=A0ACB8QYI3_9AGAM|nr:cytochrome P450 [Vararia minispora EC-137]